MTKNGHPKPNSHPEEEAYADDPTALRALRAVRDPRYYPDRSASLTMWQRILKTELSKDHFGKSESEFIKAVAAKMMAADELKAGQRSDGALAASGLSGKHRRELEIRIEEIMDLTDGFDALPIPEGTPPTAVQKKYSKRNLSLAIFAENDRIEGKVTNLQKLRLLVEKVKDHRRKKLSA